MESNINSNDLFKLFNNACNHFGVEGLRESERNIYSNMNVTTLEKILIRKLNNSISKENQITSLKETVDIILNSNKKIHKEEARINANNEDDIINKLECARLALKETIIEKNKYMEQNKSNEKEIQNLNDKIKTLEYQKEKVAQKMTSLEKEKESLLEEKSQLTISLESLNDELEDVLLRANRLEEENIALQESIENDTYVEMTSLSEEDLKYKYKELEKDRELLDLEYEKLNDEKKKFEKELEKTLEEIDSLYNKNNVDDLNDEIDFLNNRIIELEKELKEAKQSKVLDEIKNELKSTKSSLFKYKEDYTKVKKELVSFKISYDNLNKELNSIKEEYKELKQKYEDNLEELKLMENDNISHEERVKEVEKENKILEKEMKALKEEYDKLKNQNEYYKQENTKLKQEKIIESDIDKEIESIVSENNKLLLDIENLSKQIKDLEAKYNNILSEKEVLEKSKISDAKTIKKLTDANNELKIRNNTLEEDNISLLQENSINQANKNKLEEDMIWIDEEKKKIHEEKALINEKLNDIENKNEYIKLELESIETTKLQMLNDKKKIENKEAELQKFKEELDEKRADLDESISQFMDKEKMLNHNLTKYIKYREQASKINGKRIVNFNTCNTSKVDEIINDKIILDLKNEIKELKLQLQEKDCIIKSYNKKDYIVEDNIITIEKYKNNNQSNEEVIDVPDTEIVEVDKELDEKDIEKYISNIYKAYTNSINNIDEEKTKALENQINTLSILSVDDTLSLLAKEYICKLVRNNIEYILNDDMSMTKEEFVEYMFNTSYRQEDGSYYDSIFDKKINENELKSYLDYYTQNDNDYNDKNYDYKAMIDLLESDGYYYVSGNNEIRKSIFIYSLDTTDIIVSYVDFGHMFNTNTTKYIKIAKDSLYDYNNKIEYSIMDLYLSLSDTNIEDINDRSDKSIHRKIYSLIDINSIDKKYLSGISDTLKNNCEKLFKYDICCNFKLIEYIDNNNFTFEYKANTKSLLYSGFDRDLILKATNGKIDLL